MPMKKRASVHSGMFKEQYDFIRWAVEEGADCIEHAYALPDDVIRMMGEKNLIASRRFPSCS